MAIRPAFQFYPADWRGNANLRRCSEAARGAWIDILCLLHDSDEYGVIRWPLADIAQAAGLPLKLVQELVRKNVLKGADSGGADYRWAPVHAGKVGTEVVLVAAGAGPCWYCSRFVRDEYVRQRRGANTRFNTSNQPPKPQPKSAPKGAIGGRQGDGASSSSSKEHTEAKASGAEAPIPPDPIWHTGLAFLKRKGIPEGQARTFLGKLKREAGDIDAAALLAEAEANDITDPVPWLSTAAVNARDRRKRGDQPSKRLSAIHQLEAMKHGLDDPRNIDRLPKAAVLGIGQDASD